MKLKNLDRTNRAVDAKNLASTAKVLAVASAAAISTFPAFAQDTVRFCNSGVQLPGPQLRYDAGLELMDFNGDGKLDLYMPTTGMINFAVQLNEGTPTQPRFGHGISLPMNSTEVEPQTIEHVQSFATCDLNHDKLFDLILFDGELRFIPNTGTLHGPNHWHFGRDNNAVQFFPGTPQMIKENARYSTGPESFYWDKGIFARQVLTLTVTDWDGDGLEDLLICRTKDEAPGVQSAGGVEQWTAWGRTMVSPPRLPPPPADAPKFETPLKQAPARGFYFYKNVGTKEKPWFDKGVEITTPEGQSIAAPNPVVFDVDGDGVADIVSTETKFSCNAYRVDWPTAPNIQWFRRTAKGDAAHLQAAAPLLDKAGKPIPAGVSAKFGALYGGGAQDLVVLDGELKGSVRCYPNGAKVGKAAFGAPQTLAGEDFMRFDFMAQPLIVNWFGPDSRDLIIQGDTDAHCKFALRRTALYKNVATKSGEIKYTFAGWFNFNGDAAMVSQHLEDSPYEAYGSAVSYYADASGADKHLVMSVGGHLYFFSKLAKDGLTWQECKPIPLAAERNRMKGWQEIPVNTPDAVQYIRLGNDSNGMGNFRDSMLHIVNFEALSGGKNVATVDQGVHIEATSNQQNKYYRVQNPDLMFTPGNMASDDKANFTSWGFYTGPAIITLKEPAKLDKIRFLLSDREGSWYGARWPFYWQGQLYRQGTEQGQPWYNYKLEVSADGKQWTTLADHNSNEMYRTHPLMVDWDHDGKTDLVLGLNKSNGIYPQTKEYRFYRNTGNNDEPKFDTYQPFCDENGKPLSVQGAWLNTYGAQCGVSLNDLDGDGKPDLIIEGRAGGETIFYRNVSADPLHEFKFRKTQSLGDPTPIIYPSDYTYFCVDDADGDHVPDLIVTTRGALTFLKGVAAKAPDSIKELSSPKVTPVSATLQWNRPRGAESYDIRWSTQPIDDLTWAGLSGVTAPYAPDVATDKPQTAVLNGLPKGQTIYIAAKSLNEKQEVSILSPCVPVTLPPLVETILRNGPASPNAPEYNGTEIATLDAAKPDDAAPGTLSVRAHPTQPKVVLLRFKDLPKVGSLQSATLQLTTNVIPGQLQDYATLGVSCNSIRDDWNAAAATWKSSGGGQAWGESELTAGGTFLAMAQTDSLMQPRKQIQWDITPAIRAAQDAGRNSVSLLVRVDYTGKYIDGLGYNFAGLSEPDVSLRPRLVLISRAP